MLVPPQDGAEGLSDVARRKGTRGDLVEQRLEEVVVAPIDKRDLYRRVLAELLRRVKPGKAAADDEDTVPAAAGVSMPVRSPQKVWHTLIVPRNLAVVCRVPKSPHVVVRRHVAPATSTTRIENAQTRRALRPLCSMPRSCCNLGPAE